MESRSRKRAALWNSTPESRSRLLWCRAPRVQLAPRMLDVEALPDLMDVDSTRSEEPDCAAERLLLPGHASQLPMSPAHSAERVPAARVGSKRGDGNHDTTAGLSGAPDDRIALGVPYHDPLFAELPQEPLSYSYAADVLCKIARMRFPGAQLRR
jgi:hypothetical protein